MHQIRIQGQLDPRWSEWFEGFTLAVDSKGNTILTGQVADQAALHGLFRRIGDLGVILVSVNLLDQEQQP
ncbi:MAG: hypothetical protein ABI053_05925 [Lacisediminihabitans sp.]